MCGIAGVKRMGAGAPPITEEQIKTLLIGVQHRGGDATGVALQQADGSVTICKAPEIAWKFVTSTPFKEYIKEYLRPDTLIALAHTRAWTVGDPRQNNNNHPMFAGNTAVIHNGGIGNHDDLFRELKLERKAETDSDIIRAILDEEGITKSGIRALGRMRGAAAIAAVRTKEPGKLLLARSGSPLVLAKSGDQLMWASEKKALHLASREWKSFWNIFFQSNKTDLMFNPMEHATAWIITDAGVEWHDEFDTMKARQYVAPLYAVHDKYEDKQRRKAESDRQTLEDASKEEARRRGIAGTDTSSRVLDMKGKEVKVSQDHLRDGLLVKCPNPACSCIMSREGPFKDIPLFDLECVQCDTPLATKESLLV